MSYTRVPFHCTHAHGTVSHSHARVLCDLVSVQSTDSGFWIQGAPSKNVRVSHGLQIFTTSKTVLAQVTVGDEVSLSGTVAEFRSSGSPNNLFITEIQSPANITVLSSNNTVPPLVLGKRGTRRPPTQALSSLDAGRDGWLSAPNNISLVEVANKTLQPDKYGLDFWASLEGQLVTVTNPTAIDFENNFGEFWVHGDWKVTGENGRGGLTITVGACSLEFGGVFTLWTRRSIDFGGVAQVLMAFRMRTRRSSLLVHR